MNNLIKMTWPNMIHHLRKMFLESQFICQRISMKENRFCFFFVLFCFIVMKSTQLWCFTFCSWCFGKLSTRRCAWAWFHDVCTWGAKVIEYWMSYSIQIKLNYSFFFGQIEMCLWCSWKYLDEQDLMEFIW
jgi:hypothetical protein